MGILKDVLAVSGQAGLFKFISQGRNGIIVENLQTGKRTNMPASAKISALEDIAVFTESDELPLIDVLKMIKEKENGEKTISHKASSDELKTLFEEVVPDYDQDRVYVSDIKKIVRWYNELHDLKMLDFNEEENIEEENDKPGDDKTEESGAQPDDTQEKE